MAGKESHPKKALLVIAFGLVAAASLGAAILNNQRSNGDDNDGGFVSGSTPTHQGTTAPSPSGSSIAPPTPSLAAASSPSVTVTAPPGEAVEAEVRRALDRNGPAYIEAICTRSETALDAAFTGEALAFYRARVAEARANPPTRCPELVSFQLLQLSATASSASAKTVEAWRFYAASGSCSLITYDESYELLSSGAAFKVSRNTFAQRSSTTCN